VNPLSLRASNYRTFEDLAIDLPVGCLAVVGSNGAGKSSIVNVIDLCLFGPEGRSLADYLTDDADASELEIEMTFEHAGETYRVRRGFSAKGRGKTTLDFERDGEEIGGLGGWTPLTRESQKETQAAIEGVLGLSRETFRASAFLAQGDGAAFTEAQPRDRKRILAEVLGLDTWETLLEACRIDKRAAERESSELAGRISLLEESSGDVAELANLRDWQAGKVGDEEEEHRHAEGVLSDAAEQVATLERSEAAYRVWASATSAAVARLRERQAIVERAAAAKLEAVEVQRELSEAGNPSARLAELEERRAEMDRQRELRRDREVERDRLIADAEDARRQAARLEEERETLSGTLVALVAKAAAWNHPANVHTCDRCGQVLTGEAHMTALMRIREERDEAERRVAGYGVRIAELAGKVQVWQSAADAVEIPEAPGADAYNTLVDEIKDARAAELEQAGRQSKLRSLEVTIAEVTPELTAEIARLSDELVSAQEALAEIEEPEPGALDAAKVAAVTAKAELDIVARRLTESRTDLIRAESALEQATKIAAELDHARLRRDELQGELDLLALLERAYGRDGIPALIVESSAIPSIETEASRILAELGTSYRVELRTQRALKSGDGLADTLDVVVIGDAGERSYETFSGGERSRLNVALRIALARLLAHRRGAESRVLVLDEIEYLDSAGQMALAGVLQELAVSEFDKVVLVSHADALRDVFDNAITVEKTDGRSRIVA
jgi:exonuclease SbcC